MKSGIDSTILALCASAALASGAAAFTPVVTPNGSTLAYTVEEGVKVFRLTVNTFKHEMAPGMIINAWGYNGQTPGPTIEAVEGDRVRIWVKNDLPEPTAVHWHGILLPNGMDGVSGLTQRGIKPGETFRYEFTLRQHGTYMYHSHGDEMVQMGMGTMGFLVIHPKSERRKIDRDYALFLNEWFVPPGASTPNPSVMTEFNLFTFNSRIFPGTAPLLARPGERVRVRIGNVGQDIHPIHIHGHVFKVTGTDGGDIPGPAQYDETTVLVGPGQTRTFEFVAAGGDWPLHCHKRHHPMNAMGHEIPNMIGVDQSGTEGRIRSKVPGYMAMGSTGMEEMTTMGMEGPANTIPMMAGEGPFGPIGMGGMFTVIKVHPDAPRFATAAEYTARIKGPADQGWFKHPAGTVADTAGATASKAPQGPTATQVRPPAEAKEYTCPMHPEVVAPKPGKCPKCGMPLVPKPGASDTSNTR